MTDLPKTVNLTLRGHNGRVNFVKYNKLGDYCLSGSADKLIKLWNTKSGLCIKTYSGHGYEVFGLAISQDNTRFTSCGGDKSVLFWDVAAASIIRRFSGHTQRVNDVIFNKDASLIVSGSYDSTVKMWDIRSQGFKPVMNLDQAKDSVTSLVLADHIIMTGCVDGKIRTYDIRRGKLTTDVIGLPLTNIKLSLSGICVLASSLDSTIRLFDTDNGTLLNEFKGHVNQDYKISSCWARNDSLVIGGDETGKVFFWDMVTAKIVQKLDLHSKAVLSVEYNPSQEQIVTASADGTIKLVNQ